MNLMCFVQFFICVENMPDLTKNVKNRPKKLPSHATNFNSHELAGIFTPPIAAQFTLIKTDQHANVKWGVRYYRD